MAIAAPPRPALVAGCPQRRGQFFLHRQLNRPPHLGVDQLPQADRTILTPSLPREDRANAIVRKALGGLYRKYGEKWWRNQGARNLEEKVASAFEMFSGDDALEYKVVKTMPDG